ncbi:NAD(P)-dependent glycerol-1-phosphate dehydrogenase [Candidatus Bathyarchaeota archaeon]|nr:NAD(P)-dependent glycerol-1-phosphate dehydrogenase [Candidatus Bathyarchaeota archaeon]
MTDQINSISRAYHRIDLPRIVVIGDGVINGLGGICTELGYSNALIVTGNNTLKIAGEKVQNILEKSAILSRHIFVSDAQLETVGRVMEEAKKDETEVLVGVGGGRNIDVAKLAAAKTGLPFISVPTVASHDGIASNLASIKGMERPYTMKAASPVAVVMDSKIILESPYRYTASGCGDIISKATEVADWKLAHKEKNEYYGGYSGSLALMSSELVMENVEEICNLTENGIRTLLEALISCGVAMSIAGSSRPCSGSAHLFSHALDLIAPQLALHGEQCGVGSIMMAKLHGLDWEKIRSCLKTLNAPITAKDLKIDRELIIKALVIAQSVRPERYTILSKITLNENSAEELAEECDVI